MPAHQSHPSNPLDLPARLRQRRETLTAKELAALLHCTSSYLLKRAKAGKVPAYRIGGLIRFDPARIAEWLEQSEGIKNSKDGARLA